MKKFLLPLFGIGLLCACQQQANDCQIVGKSLDITGDTLILRVVNADQSDIERTDTIVMKDKGFTYTAKDSVTKIVVLSGLDESNRGAIRFYMIPGEKAEITGNLKDYTIGGSSLYMELQEAGKPLKSEMKKILDLQDEFMKKIEQGQNRDSLIAAFEPIADSIQNKMNEMAETYIKANPDKDASIDMLNNIPDRFGNLDGIITDRVKNGKLSSVYQVIKKSYEREEARKKAAEMVTEGKPAPDFTLKALDGSDFKLSSLKGKYVILDFWGSWCGWCIKGMPEMKKYYAKYKNKMEIVGIDCRDTEEKWRNAVKELELPWIHVQNSEANDVTATYAIQGFPTKFVIDPQGTIAKVVVGEDPAFYQYLDKALK